MQKPTVSLPSSQNKVQFGRKPFGKAIPEPSLTRETKFVPSSAMRSSLASDGHASLLSSVELRRQIELACSFDAEVKPESRVPRNPFDGPLEERQFEEMMEEDQEDEDAYKYEGGITLTPKLSGMLSQINVCKLQCCYV
ncbi:unnamed protein product [Protopolystoma xenopodis]|uniref:Uncharacterized protein n=1 Tax=Protopolystoma xenopodis TaxID=117903 RepID=A0A3S5CK79_9PLAT|nr:unnamed protein product [Protopolystoma xenopodis]